MLIDRRVRTYSKRDFYFSLSFFFSFFPFCFRKMTRSRSSSPAPDVFPIYFLVYLFSSPATPPSSSSLSSSLHRLRLEKTLRLRRDCLPRSRSIGREAPSFLPGVHVLHHHSQLPRKSDRKLSKLTRSWRRQLEIVMPPSSLPWCTLYVNVKLSKACAELKITYQL